MPKISKAEFIHIMESLRSLNDDIDAVDTAMRKLDPDFGGFHLARVRVIALDLLFILMGSKEDISYFIYDLEWGAKWKPGMITAADGRDIKMATPSDLYDELDVAGPTDGAEL